MKVVTGGEMRAIEAAGEQQGISIAGLMQRAGRAVADACIDRAPRGQVLILCGPGNNGGDGVVAAERLQDLRRSVSVYTFHRSDVGRFEGPVIRDEEDPGQEALRAQLTRADVVVDALLGTGQNRDPRDALKAILQVANAAPRPAHRLAVDIPTGVNADTGAILGTAFHADATLCMGFLKCGCVVYPGAEPAGAARVVDLDIPAELAAGVKSELPASADIARLIPVRSRNSNKGTFGRVAVVGGSRDFMGAPALVSIGALRIGAGLVQAATPESVQSNVAAHTLEPIYAPLPETDGKISARALPILDRVVENADSVVFGPGMGQGGETLDVAHGLLDLLSTEKSPPAVIDADGLNALSRLPDWWDRQARLVLTPHPGEMSRLSGVPVAEIQTNRLEVARRFAAIWGVVLVLKGAGTVIAEPGGRASVNPTGGPNLATGGTGDVLSGIIGGLLAEGVSPWNAAVAGTYLHGLAADVLAADHGDAGMLAGDLLPVLPGVRARLLREEGKHL